MSYIIHDDLDWEIVHDSRSCTGCQDGRCTGMCNGFVSMSQRRRDPVEAARLKAERARKQEDEILAKADEIRRRRGQ